MKVLVTGASGQLGYDVVNELLLRGFDAYGTDIVPSKNDFKVFVVDLSNKHSFEELINTISPDVIIHCAGWTAVDDAEKNENFQKVFSANVLSTKNIVSVCGEKNIKMIYISTDYVFDGKGDKAWEEDCKAFAPQNIYGLSKLCGEYIVSSTIKNYFIVRISWAFGINGKNFIKTMLSLKDKGCKEINVVSDQIGSLTYTKDLAKLLADMITTDKYGCYHVTNSGDYVSWATIAREVFKIIGADIKVNNVLSSDYKTLAHRPLNSRLSKTKLIENGFTPLPDWKNALKRYLEELKK